MEDQIKLYETLARERDRIRKSLLKDREQKTQKETRDIMQAHPIVGPIVEAISKAKTNTKNPLVTFRNIEEHVEKVLKFNLYKLNRTEFLNLVQNTYQNEPLFNVLLAMVRLGYVNRFPIRKMVTVGAVDSLIFYGQSGGNLDFAAGMRQNPEFKTRLDHFNNFYKLHEKTIEEVFKALLEKERQSPIDDTTERRLLPILSSSDDEDGDSSIEEDDTHVRYFSDDNVIDEVQGSGLKERLGVVHASREAGNTSLDIVNEAHDILKMLLQHKEISLDQYKQVKHKFK